MGKNYQVIENTGSEINNILKAGETGEFTIAQKDIENLKQATQQLSEEISSAAGDINILEEEVTTAQGNIEELQQATQQLSEDMIVHLKDGVAEGSLRTTTAAEETVTYSLGEGAFAEGRRTQASGVASHAEGSDTVASALGSHAEGRDTTANELYAHAEGMGTQASGTASHAEGSGTIAKGAASHVSGKYNIADNENKYAVIVGNGTDSQRSNAFTLGWNGNAWAAKSVAIGDTTDANGNNSIAIGTGVSANSNNQLVVGQYNGIDFYNTYAVIVGNGEESPFGGAERSNAFTLDWGGNGTFSGEVTDGHGNKISEVIKNLKDGTANGSLRGSRSAEESIFYSMGAGSVTLGEATTASGKNSFVSGNSSEVNGDNSAAIGVNLLASGDNQLVTGMGNIEDNNGDYAVIVGNGEEILRSNAYTLDWQGNGTFAGDVEDGNGNKLSDCAKPADITAAITTHNTNTSSHPRRMMNKGDITVDDVNEGGAECIVGNVYKLSNSGTILTEFGATDLDIDTTGFSIHASTSDSITTIKIYVESPDALNTLYSYLKVGWWIYTNDYIYQITGVGQRGTGYISYSCTSDNPSGNDSSGFVKILSKPFTVSEGNRIIYGDRGWEKLTDSNTLREPSSGLAVGKYFRITSIDNDGHAVLECVSVYTIVKDALCDGQLELTDAERLAALASFGATPDNDGNLIFTPQE